MENNWKKENMYMYNKITLLYPETNTNCESTVIQFLKET